MGKKEIRELGNELVGLQGGISLYRKGIDEFFLSHGFEIAEQKLNAARPDLEQLGLYQQCRHALSRAHDLVKMGPTHDEEAETLILNANRALMKGAGIYEEMLNVVRNKPNATLDDFKPDPDAWAEEDRRGKR